RTAAMVSVEVSRPVLVADITSDAATHVVQATDREMSALAQRLELFGLAKFTAELALARVRGGEILVAGRVRARVTQTCIVTLGEVEGEIDETFELKFTPDTSSPPADMVISGTHEDPPEPLDGETIDIGEIAAQQLSLALDPYPRAPGVDFEAIDAGPEAGGQTAEKPAVSGPFAALARLKGRPDGQS
ncbi:MAG: DUF177 domain-containing protein, partial [Alphaproteobacteria bacterium]|nr:DUF177 domain-containing protein [Alphaproteobacteria bacterium]